MDSDFSLRREFPWQRSLAAAEWDAAYEKVIETVNNTIGIGSGPERCVAHIDDNPNWLRNHAANAIALAEYLEDRDTANSEAEREEREQVEALANLMRQANNPAAWVHEQIVPFDHFARVLVKAGVRAPQSEAEQTCEGGC